MTKASLVTRQESTFKIQTTAVQFASLQEIKRQIGLNLKLVKSLPFSSLHWFPSNRKQSLLLRATDVVATPES